MISSFDYYKKIENPNMYLCNPDKRPICALNAEDRHLVLRFNDLSDLTFTVPKIKGNEDNYALVESKRLIYVEKIGWFQIETANETIAGNVCKKEVTARSHQYTLKNRGFITEERVYMFYNPNDPYDNNYDSNNVAAMPSVIGQLYQQAGIQIALQATDLEQNEDKGEWTVVYIDPILKFRAASYGAMYVSANGYDNVCRSFDANENLNGYDFIINEVEKAFEVIFEFDFLYHTIKVKALDDITKSTDIYLSFDNIMNSLSITENAEDVVTVMSCNGGSLDIRTVNPMGTNYIVDFEYYKKKQSDDGKIDYPWMSKELIDALDEWKTEFDKCQSSYADLVLCLQSLYISKAEKDDAIRSSNLKLTDMQVARDQYINKEDEDIEGAGTITGETVLVGSTSIKPLSSFYSTPFTGESIIVGHVNIPTMTKSADGVYTFSFTDSGTLGAADTLIQDYYDDESGFDGVDTPLYFMDEDNRSYCKLNIDTIVEITKDVNGNPTSFIHNTGDDWVSKYGYITIDGIEFTVYKANAVDSYTLSLGEFSLRFTSNSYFVYNGIRYRAVASADGIVSLYKYYVSGFDRFTTYKETAGIGGWCDLWENYITNVLVAELNVLNEQIDSTTQAMEAISDLCNIQKFIKRKGNDLYNELSNYWIEGEYTNDNIAVHDSTTMAERIDLAKELMAAGEVDLSKCAQPKFEMSVDAINFIKMYEFRQFTNELSLGKTITIEKADGIHYHPALMSLEYDLDVSNSFTMTFSNASKPGDTAMTFADLIKESSSTSRTVSANWSNLTDYTRNKEQITRLIEYPLDRALRAMQAGLASQSFIIDENGILGRKYEQEFDGANGTFSPEQVRLINNTIIFTNDNWNTAALALGKTEYGYGLVADVLVGELILGEKISIGSNSERVRIDNGGLLIKNDEGEAVFEADANGDVTLRGTVYATSGEFSGTIRAERGEIGGYVIGEDTLIGNNVGMKSNNTIASQSSESGVADEEHSVNAIAFWSGSSVVPDAPFRVYNDGYMYATNAEICGKIYATDGGTIGGFTIGTNNISSGDGGLTINQSGLVIAQQLEVKDYFKANSLEIKKISGRYENSAYLDFEQSGVQQHNVIVSVSYVVTDAGSEGVLTVGWKPGSATVTVSTNVALTSSKTFTVTLGYHDSTGSHTKTEYVSIAAGQTSGSIAVANRARFPFGGGQGDVETLYTVSVSPTDYWENSSVTLRSISCDGSFLPASKGSNHQLGSADYLWNQVWAQNSTIQTSDIHEKHEIEELGSRYSTFFDTLKPVSFKMNNGTSGRKHIGFIANEVKASLDSLGIDSKDFAGYCEWENSEGQISCGLRYEEFIALSICEIQELKKKVSELENSLVIKKNV